MTRPRFHLAFPVDDLAAARDFYAGVLGCAEGREMEGHWIDFDLKGHQIVAHFSPEECSAAKTGDVDGKSVPVRHFGLILEWDDWNALKDRLQSADADFIIEPYVRFEGKPGEQATMFVRDPAGNALEFKAFRDDRMVFDKGLRETG
ncbi:VOC family protein [Parvularcula sp. ZS-1/3]|uniref:VOC family protein n=1 Tax=Parvularcula mediterranea TaxID=2732508 RepID=A0A7Y3RQ55_9PROT|nr:VOC family protein [Parvularcula mediterranea]NNU17696.1 VOC family protein [Parvularcula mediterranea]